MSGLPKHGLEAEPLDDAVAEGRDAEIAASKYMNELTAKLLGGELAANDAARRANPQNCDVELDSTTAASLEKFMASLKEHLQLAPETWSGSAGKHNYERRRQVHRWTCAEQQTHVRDAIREYMRQEQQATCTPMTTVRCLHASVAQKSYGSEKRFLCPPPAVHIHGRLRHAETIPPSLFVQVQGEEGDHLSGEQLAVLDEAHQARFTELHVTGTGKAKSFRLLLHLLASDDKGPARDAKRARLSDDADTRTARLLESACWASFASAPIGIISKPSKKTAKARSVSAHISTSTQVSLFNRINSQTYRTKYLCAQDGQLSAQSRAWTAFTLVVLERPSQASRDTEDHVLAYGATILFMDSVSGAATDPLLVCKVDRGCIIPPFGDATHAPENADEVYAFGAVNQMQKIALMRCTGDRKVDACTPRSYLCAGAPMPPTAGFGVLGHADDARSLPLNYAPSRPATWHQDNGPQPLLVDEALDAFCWTLVGISHFEYSFIDLDMLHVPSAPPYMGLPLTPFPIVTRMPFYETTTHELAMSVQNFYYSSRDDALQSPAAMLSASRTDTKLETMQIWLGPLGPLPFVATATQDTHETDVLIELPKLKAMLGTQDRRISQCMLPLLFVRGIDGSIYHSGRTIARA
ncbi:hypothetical protein MVES_000576 [Malassezia vespertilionis]|uniref:Uncharacterized protein n=1 Tax=Malassezia vespertilionis TaxID=2020962 RepID=A0A2N1JHC3_9BASI|nr:hypothetical protein MVES_000576 [Malassezia vespertilionis]